MLVLAAQTATWDFLGPVAAAYIIVCTVWLAVVSLRPQWWPTSTDHGTRRPWLDLALVVVAAAAVLGFGQLYRANLLIPAGSGTWSHASFALNNLIIFSPLAIVLAIRRQSPATVFASGRGLLIKLAAGVLGAIIAVTIYHTLRGEAGFIIGSLRGAFEPRALGHFPAVFLEGVALAFVLVRLRWALGLVSAIAVPSLLFALAHIPRQLEDRLPASGMAVFFVVNAGLTAAILLLILRGRDVIWLGIVHYVMDVAIKAFD